MDKNWLIFLVAFILVVSAITGATVIVKTAQAITDTLDSPASTTNISIQHLEFYAPDSGAQLSLDNMRIEANSKIIDLILIAAIGG